jgi:hypothetical protein
MPPDARVCVGCKSSKVSCVGFIAGVRACKRCVRLGLECIPAPARAKGAVRKLMKKSTLELVLPDDSHARPPAAPICEAGTFAGAVMAGTLAGARLPSEATISEAVMAPHDGVSLEQRLLTLRMLLQTWARIGRQRNAYTLTAFVVFLCQKHKLHLAEVMGSSAVPAPAQSGGEAGPSGVAPPHLGGGGASDEGTAPLTYRMTRTCYDDRMVFEANEAFEQNVCSVAELDACWRRNDVEVKSLFGHPDDAEVYRTAAASLWRRVMTGPEVRVDGSAPVRLRVRTPPHSKRGARSAAAAAAARTYTWCSLRASLTIMHGSERVTLEWEPLPELGLPTELEEAPQILRVGAPEGDGADGEGADLQIDDGLLEELLGDDGDTALRDAGAAALRELEEHFGASYNV